MYIVTDRGVPHIAESLVPLRVNTLGAIGRAWEDGKAFDANFRYEAHPNQELTFSLLQRFLAHTFYNPALDIEIRWEKAEATNLDEIIREVESGLETDDDLIQQWLGADDVLKLLRSATSFEGLCDRVECICGGFEVHDRLREIVEDVLGSEPAEQVGADQPTAAPGLKSE